jgi:hypothetical protein
VSNTYCLPNEDGVNTVCKENGSGVEKVWFPNVLNSLMNLIYYNILESFLSGHVLSPDTDVSTDESLRDERDYIFQVSLWLPHHFVLVSY